MTITHKFDRKSWAVFLIFLRLGLTSFGGPIAHLAYFRAEFVVNRRWLSERSYSDLVALCQFLPGPTSSQVGIALGLSRAGYIGALAAWTGFTLPSAIVLILFALGISSYGNFVVQGALHGLKVVAVAVVAQAVWGMARNLCTDGPRISIMVVSTGIVLLVPFLWGQIGVIAIAAIAGWLFLAPAQISEHDPLIVTINRREGACWLSLFFALLVCLPLLAKQMPDSGVAVVDSFFRVGSLVFGGGHVVLPLLQAEVVPPGWISKESFLAGYGAAQAVPGPLFTFAGFLGASMNTPMTGWVGGLACIAAIFAPSFLLVFGVMPFWDGLRQRTSAQTALAGVNAAVVGLVLAALYSPVWTSAIFLPQDFALALLAAIALIYWKLPPWLVAVCTAVGGWLLTIAL